MLQRAIGRDGIASRFHRSEARTIQERKKGKAASLALFHAANRDDLTAVQLLTRKLESRRATSRNAAVSWLTFAAG